jgi:hypothetical protein
MAQYELLLTQNTAAEGIDFSEKYVKLTHKDILTGQNATGGDPTVLSAASGETDINKVLKLITDGDGGVKLGWASLEAGHTQNTDTGTTSQTFQLQSGSSGAKLKNNSGVFEARNAADSAYADAKFKDVVVNNLTVEGTETIINTETLTVEDKNIELGKVETPTDTTADGGGITLKGTTDKTIIWDNTNDNWTLNQNVNIPTGNVYKINNTTVLSATQVHGKTLGTMSEEAAADYVAKSLFDAQTILHATSDNTPAALTVGEQTIVGRKTAGNIAALSAAEVRTILNVADGANAYTHPNHTGDVTSLADGATTIANSAVTLAKMANVDSATVFYRKTASAGAPEVQTLATLKSDLGTMPIAWVSAPATKTSTGTAGQAAYDSNFLYVCTGTDVWKRSVLATNW